MDLCTSFVPRLDADSLSLLYRVVKPQLVDPYQVLQKQSYLVCVEAEASGVPYEFVGHGSLSFFLSDSVLYASFIGLAIRLLDHLLLYQWRGWGAVMRQSVAWSRLVALVGQCRLSCIYFATKSRRRAPRTAPDFDLNLGQRQPYTRGLCQGELF